MSAVTNPPGDADLRTYYARRAREYEAIYHKPERQADLRTLEAWLPGVFANRRVLEIACGTGWWSPHGASACTQWLATDANPEVIEIARSKPLPAGKVRFALVDAYTLAELGDAKFDAAFAGFWWSHVPVKQLPDFLRTLHARLAPGSPVVFMDNRYVAGSSTPLSRTDAHGNTYQQRTLADGSTHEVMKNFPQRDEVLALLGKSARDIRWTELEFFWTLEYTTAGRN
ncbi:methylase involved in ubiquinone/menaquinone biosynthesis [Burkholderiales bacterium JOSHI_001]|nr:methylase involved in ubiquinone/menaquinone biosynthesis [Burkholderiales bacterium JOSHI_001]